MNSTCNREPSPQDGETNHPRALNLTAITAPGTLVPHASGTEAGLTLVTRITMSARARTAPSAERPAPPPENLLYYGDNLDVLRRYIADESVDLVYLDPPFNSNQDYNVLFKERDGKRAAARAYQEVVEAGGKVSQCMQAFRTFLGENDMLAYLSMMAPRLVELRRVLKSTGSIYLHCDPTANAYLRMLMDAVFGPANFCNEIVWKRTFAHSSARRYGPIHDTLLFYTKSDAYTWNRTYQHYDQDYVDTFFDQCDPDGRRWMRMDLTGNGIRHGDSGKPWRGSMSPRKVDIGQSHRKL